MTALLLFWPALLHALDVQISAPGETYAVSPTQSWTPRTSPDSLVCVFGLYGTFEENESIGNGIAATLLIVVDLWQEKSNWWDALQRSRALVYRFRSDVWTGEVELLDQSGQLRRFANRDALRIELERLHEIALGARTDFENGKSYYVTVKAMLRPLSLEDLESVDAWLSGKVTGAEGSGILGIPKAVARALFGASGLGDQSATARSTKFMPRP